MISTALPVVVAIMGVIALAMTIDVVPSVWGDRFVARRVRALRPQRLRTHGPSDRLRSHRLVRAVHSMVMADRDRRRSRAELLMMVDRIVRGLRSGASPTAAVLDAAAGSPTAIVLCESLGRGEVLAEAVVEWSSASPVDGVPLVALALGLTSRIGGASATVLDGVATSLRDGLALEREVAASSSQARASAAVLVVAPIGALVMGSVIDPRLLQVAVGTPIGWACLLSGGALDVLGALWMRRLVRSVAR